MADDIVTNIYFSLGEGQSVDDILSRLRNRYPNVVHPHLLADAQLIGSAADEIVRLRADVEQLTNGNNIMGVLWNAERALAEERLIESNRLRAEVKRKADYAERMDALAEERLIESNRLRVAGDALVESLDHSRADIRSAVAGWEEARRG